MKNRKRFLSVFLAVMLLMLFVQISFAEDISYGDEGNIHWSLNRDTGVLTITGSGSMPNCSQFHCPWGWQSRWVKKVIIGNGITSIGASCFSDEINLTQVVLPSSLTAIRTAAFNGCRNIETIVIPENVRIIEEGAFCGCELLSSINIPDQVQIISKMVFAGCSYLTEIDLPDSISCIDADAFYGCTRLESINIPQSVVSIGSQAFRDCQSLRSITFPNGLVSISFNTFQDCLELENIIIPNSVQSIESAAFYGCVNLTNATLSNAITEVSSSLFDSCSKLKSIIIPSNVTSIEGYAFHGCGDLREVYIPKSVTTFNTGAFNGCSRLKDVYYEGTENEWNQITGRGTIPSSTTIHFKADPTIWFPQGNGIYNLGEETYSFENYSDGHSAGHCFGMSMTSAGYYNNYLNMSMIGESRTLYDYDDNGTVRAPICHYQDIQGSFAEGAVVAGGSRYFGNDDIDSDWDEALQYVRNHDYDNKGDLTITFFSSRGGHAVNFLYFDEVDGEERIYAYDNNFPEVETYFYKDNNGRIQQTPESTFGTRIRSFSLLDVRNYFQAAKRFNLSRVVYAQRGEVNITGAKASQMVGVIEPGERIMYELPDDLAQVRITPQANNATFTYMDETYTFGEIDGDTYGVLTLSSAEGGTGTLKIENAPTTEPDTPVTPDNPQPENLCPWCGDVHEGFFGGLVGFFHRIFAALFGARH